MTMKTSLLTTLTFQVLLSTAFAQTPTRPAPAAHDMTTAASTVAGPADAPNDYRLNPGDKLAIDVHEDKSLSETLQIRPDGKITLPLVGDIPAAGRTTNDLRGAIAAALKEYIAQPTVTVIVQETAPQVVYVMGEVSKPGPQ
ncbi:MAG: polysaccharide biosynthesis/export family protein, partial [Vicinamibacterales bacterium]